MGRFGAVCSLRNALLTVRQREVSCHRLSSFTFVLSSRLTLFFVHSAQTQVVIVSHYEGYDPSATKSNRPWMSAQLTSRVMLQPSFSGSSQHLSPSTRR